MAENIFERDAIRNIQRYLRQLSLENDSAVTIPVDGIWAEQTRRALMRFQRAEGLPVTGTVDRDTWAILKQKYDESVALNSPPLKLDLFPRNIYGGEYEMTLGESGFLVDTVQYLLGELSRLYGFPDYTPSGTYDEKTEELVRDFQKKNGIEVTGRVGRETWDAMAAQHNLLLESEE
ncbi:MAG: peptidoglycan-binding protein [Ruminococcaceae bacterium]|nr:peptidoglycan-binding protein [Oscillospiraceae bacterium]